MRGFVFLTGLVFLMGLAGVAEAAQEACEKARSSADVMKCLSRQHDVSQAELNKVFDSLSLENSGEALEALKDLQVRWVEYRDRECAMETAHLETESLKRLETLRCLQRLTLERIGALQKSLKPEEPPEERGETAAPPRWMNALASDYADVFWAYGAQAAGDLDCDGEDEHVMGGVRPLEDLVGVVPVIAISENPATGRPKAIVLRPDFFQPEDDEVTPVACGLVTELEIVPAPKANEVTEGEDAGVVQVEKPFCGAQLIVSAAHCKRSVSYIWDGKEYVRRAEQ